MEGFTKRDRRKPVEKRITYEVDGEQRRLGWIAENRPEFLIKRYYVEWPNNASAFLSALAKVGYGRARIMKEVIEHPEWGIDPGILGQY